jgi:glycosyltransferase involved in cell wall biosynthesis
MRILIVHQYALLGTEAGVNRHHALAKCLMAQGHEVMILASAFNHFKGEPRFEGTMASHHREIHDGIEFLWVPTPTYQGNGPRRVWNILAFAWAVWRRVPRWKMGKFDVIVGSSPYPFAACAAALLARREKTPFVLEIRDLWPETLKAFSNLGDWHPAVVILAMMERWMLRQARQTVCALPEARAYLEEKGAAPGSVTWIPNGVDLATLPRLLPPPPPTPFIVCYSGSHGLANGLDSMLDAARWQKLHAEDASIQWWFIGDGPDRERLVQRAEAEGLTNVVFHQAVPKAQLYPYLQQVHAFLMTTRNLDLYRFGVSPNKLHDYLACGRPIVFGTTSPNDPVKAAGAGITVKAEDPIAMAQAVLQLQHMSETERNGMGERGRAYAEAHHEFRHLAKDFERVLELATNAVREKG